MRFIYQLSGLAVRMEKFSHDFVRISIAIVIIWIGALKFFDYEAEGIVPFVANSPLMYFFYSDFENYESYMLKEGEVDQKKKDWHIRNHTYSFAYGLGILLLMIGTLLLINYPVCHFAGGVLVIIMSLGTLSFIVTTPESWVPEIGGPNHGIPFLSARGRLVVKDLIMLAGGFLVMVNGAKEMNRTRP